MDVMGLYECANCTNGVGSLESSAQIHMYKVLLTSLNNIDIIILLPATGVASTG